VKYIPESEVYIRHLLVAVVLLCISGGCASNLFVEMKVDRYLPGEDYTVALTEIESHERKFGERNRLLFLFNRGALNFYSDRYIESLADFREAARVSEELFTRSISTEAAGLVNPNITPYDGEDYEKVMIHIYAAFNYIKLGELEEAGVEARIINQKLELLAGRYEAENKYRNDAFARYLSGIIYEATGEVNNAYISYKLALDAYRDYRKMFPSRIPIQLKKDILRLAGELGFTNQYESYSSEFGISGDAGNFDNSGEAVVIAMTGMAPFKRELEASFTHVDDEGKTHTFQILIPEMVERDGDIAGVYTGTAGVGEVGMEKAELVHDLSGIAVKNMSDKMPGIMIRAWLRALAKFRATEKAKKEMKTDSKLGNILIGSITDAFAESVTHADIRCWRTLPARIHMRRLRLEPGSHDLVVEMRGTDCRIERIVKNNVEIRKNRFSFIFAESFK